MAEDGVLCLWLLSVTVKTERFQFAGDGVVVEPLVVPGNPMVGIENVANGIVTGHAGDVEYFLRANQLAAKLLHQGDPFQVGIVQRSAGLVIVLLKSFDGSIPPFHKGQIGMGVKISLLGQLPSDGLPVSVF